MEAPGGEGEEDSNENGALIYHVEPQRGSCPSLLTTLKKKSPLLCAHAEMSVQNDGHCLANIIHCSTKIMLLYCLDLVCVQYRKDIWDAVHGME